MVVSGLGGNLVLNMCFVPKTGKNPGKKYFQTKEICKIISTFQWVSKISNHKEIA